MRPIYVARTYKGLQGDAVHSAATGRNTLANPFSKQ